MAACHRGGRFFGTLLLRQLPDAVPAILRDIRRPAESEPDLSRVLPRGDRLHGGEIAELAQDQVPGHDAAVGVTELAGDGQPELTHSHATTLATRGARPAGRLASRSSTETRKRNDERPGDHGRG